MYTSPLSVRAFHFLSLSLSLSLSHTLFPSPQDTTNDSQTFATPKSLFLSIVLRVWTRADSISPHTMRMSVIAKETVRPITA